MIAFTANGGVRSAFAEHANDRAVLAHDFDAGDRNASVSGAIDRPHHVISLEKILATATHRERSRLKGPAAG